LKVQTIKKGFKMDSKAHIERMTTYKIGIFNDMEYITQIQNARPIHPDNEMTEIAIEHLIDLASQHLIVRDNDNNIIGGMRLLQTPRGFSGLLEHAALYNVYNLPMDHTNEGILEASRAWAKDGKRTLFLSMLKTLILFCKEREIRYIFFSSSEEYLNLYTKLGCTKVGTFEYHKTIWFLLKYDLKKT
jgi:hypothetical protein